MYNVQYSYDFYETVCILCTYSHRLSCENIRWMEHSNGISQSDEIIAFYSQVQMQQMFAKVRIKCKKERPAFILNATMYVRVYGVYMK